MSLDEHERLARLHALAILDTEPEPLFDALAQAAAEVCGTPIALVSLVDARRQWFKAAWGLAGTRETPREHAFCAHAIADDVLMEVPDALADPRFTDNPLVRGAPDIRFYAGMPLCLSDGARLGTLCVIDRTPRVLTDTQRRFLAHLADIASTALDMRSAAIVQTMSVKSQHEADLLARERHYRLIVEDQTELISLADVDGQLRFVNAAYARFFNEAPQDALKRTLYDSVPEAERPALRAHLARLHEEEVLQGENLVVNGQGLQRWVAWTNRCLRDADGKVVGIHSVGRDVTDWRAATDALRVERERLDLATRANGIGIWEYELDTGRLSWSEQMFTIFGLARESFGGTLEDWRRTVHPDDLAGAEAAMQRALEGAGPLDVDFRVVHPDGEVRSVNARAKIVNDGQGRPFRMVGSNLDVTDRKRMERELAEKHELLRVTLMSIGDAVITTDAHAQVRWMNPAAERMTGWRTIQAQGAAIETVFSLEDESQRQPAACPVRRCLAEGEVVPYHQANVLCSRDGSEYGIEESAAPIRDDQGQVLGAILVFRDVTEQRRLGREMSFRATHDPLTGLLNRSEFEQRLGTALHQATLDGTQHTLLYMDLDQFKLVNDACGHAAGDLLLRQVAALLQRSVRAQDTIARLGGDEFAIILSHCSVEQAQRAAQQICDEMAEYRFVHDDRRFRVGASIGLAPLDSRWRGIAQAQQAADSACYAAKEAGRNRVHAWYDTDQALRARQGETQWATRLEQALDEDQFELFAQRITPLSQQHTEGLHAEVLIRLRGADGGLIAPGAFLPAAERFHMASRIDRWVLRHTFARLADADLAHVDTVAINLSGQSIGDSAFHADVRELLSTARFDVRKLCLEVTETAIIARLDEARDFIMTLRQHGVRFALDDFGAGASSFGYLKQLPVDYLKIDGQFIRDLTTDVLDQAAVRCFHDVAQVLGLRTIAEFVDRDDTVAALRQIGIDYAQGYRFHRPEPLQAALQLDSDDDGDQGAALAGVGAGD
jgi:diguanylate cyclase (GGDEF)-like protein/PAS domain S-box-containing protein